MNDSRIFYQNVKKACIDRGVKEDKMLNLAIRIYYIAVPACMVLQTIVLGYMAVVLNKMRKGRRHESRRT